MGAPIKLETASDLIDQYGLKFRISTSDEAKAKRWQQEFRDLGMKCRVTETQFGKAVKIHRGFSEYNVAWRVT